MNMARLRWVCHICRIARHDIAVNDIGKRLKHIGFIGPTRSSIAGKLKIIDHTKAQTTICLCIGPTACYGDI